MKLLTQQQFEQLKTNGSDQNREKDHFPVVKIFLPGTNCTWLLTEIDPEEPTIAFGLCDLGMGFPELGNVSLEELENTVVRGIYRVERDHTFAAKYPLSVYAEAARMVEAITENENHLKRASVIK